MRLIFLFFLLPQLSIGQSLVDLILAYEMHCNELVPDTTTQTGTVSYELVPVEDKNGKIIAYGFGKADTVWNAVDCEYYKENPPFYSIPGSWGLLGGGRITNLGQQYEYPISGTEKVQKTTVKITRAYVCLVKRRRVQSFCDHFWEWVKEYKVAINEKADHK